jgi:NHL repeat
MDPNGVILTCPWLAMDSAGGLFVADRADNRIQIFDQEGNLFTTWKQLGRPSGHR